MHLHILILSFILFNLGTAAPQRSTFYVEQQVNEYCGQFAGLQARCDDAITELSHHAVEVRKHYPKTWTDPESASNNLLRCWNAATLERFRV